MNRRKLRGHLLFSKGRRWPNHLPRAQSSTSPKTIEPLWSTEKVSTAAWTMGTLDLLAWRNQSPWSASVTHRKTCRQAFKRACSTRNSRLKKAVSIWWTWYNFTKALLSTTIQSVTPRRPRSTLRKFNFCLWSLTSRRFSWNLHQKRSPRRDRDHLRKYSRLKFKYRRQVMSRALHQSHLSPQKFLRIQALKKTVRKNKTTAQLSRESLIHRMKRPQFWKSLMPSRIYRSRKSNHQGREDELNYLITQKEDPLDLSPGKRLKF